MLLSEFFTSIIELYLANPLAQIFGFIAMVIVLSAFIQKDDTKTIKFLLCANLFWGIVFFLLESYAGLAAVIIANLRLLLSLKYKKNMKVFLGIIMVIIIFGIITYKNIFSLLPVTASLLGAYGFMFLSGLYLRILLFGISFLWLVYHALIGSLGGVINQIMVHIFLLIAIYKFMGIEGHSFNVMDKVRGILHPDRNMDYGDYIIIKDKDKISTKYRLRDKIRYSCKRGWVDICKLIEKIKIFIVSKLKKS